MKSLHKWVVLVFICVRANACIISPFQITIHNSEQLKDESSIFFFGRLDSQSIDIVNKIQLVKFTIIHSYKGDVSGQISIVNDLSSSCSRAFENPMSAYYVFAMQDSESNNYKITGSATFVPLDYSIEYGWSPEL
jgi:hypothetical protein